MALAFSLPPRQLGDDIPRARERRLSTQAAEAAAVAITEAARAAATHSARVKLRRSSERQLNAALPSWGRPADPIRLRTALAVAKTAGVDVETLREAERALVRTLRAPPASAVPVAASAAVTPRAAASCTPIVARPASFEPRAARPAAAATAAPAAAAAPAATPAATCSLTEGRAAAIREVRRFAAATPDTAARDTPST